MPAVRPYSGVTILDLTYRFGCYATRLFADLGARVMRIEPTGDQFQGSEASRGGHEFLNAGKEAVSIDFSTVDGNADFNRLAAAAQLVFIERGAPMFDSIGRLRLLNSSAVIVAISPFGMDGPLCDAPASDLVLQAAGGIAWMSGRLDSAPLSLPAGQAAMVTSVYAATVAAIAFVDAEATGTGHLIDVSVQECIAHSLQNAIQVWDLEERISMRGGEGTRDASEDIFPSSDGYVFLASPLSLGTSWSSLVAWIKECGHPAGAELAKPCWSDREWRLTGEARRLFRETFSAFTRTKTKAELTREAIARRIVLGPVNRISDLLADEQLAHTSFFTTIEDRDGPRPFPGPPYRFSSDVWAISAAAPAGGSKAGREKCE